jgi:hypothetical protein
MRRFMFAALCAMGLALAGCTAGPSPRPAVTADCKLTGIPRLQLASGPPTPVTRVVVGGCVEIVVPSGAPATSKVGGIVLQPTGKLQLVAASTRPTGLRTSIYLARLSGSIALSETVPAKRGSVTPEWSGVVIVVPGG